MYIDGGMLIAQIIDTMYIMVGQDRPGGSKTSLHLSQPHAAGEGTEMHMYLHSRKQYSFLIVMVLAMLSTCPQFLPRKK